LSFFAALKKKIQTPLLWEACWALNMEQAACLPFGMGYMVTGELDLVRMLVVVGPSAALAAPFEMLVFPETHPVQCIHNFLFHDRWHRGFAAMKEERSLT
jgi:hypothetical protein